MFKIFYPGLAEEFGLAVNNIEIPITVVCPYPELCDSQESTHLSHFEKAHYILNAFAKAYEITRYGAFQSDLKGTEYPLEDEKSVLLESVKQLGQKSVVNFLITADFFNLFDREYTFQDYYYHLRRFPYFQYRVIRSLESELQQPFLLQKLPGDIVNRINGIRQHQFYTNS